MRRFEPMKRFLKSISLALLLAAALVPPGPAYAESGTWSADGTSANVFLPDGRAWILLTGTWGSGTASFEVLLEDGVTFQPLKDYTADPTSKGEVWDFGGVPMLVRIDFAGSTSPSLVYELRAAPKRN